jgi:hypothetical protein
MRKRVKTLGGAVAALVALALGGSAIASATQGDAKHATKPAVAQSAENATAPDSDGIQAGDQTTPDLSRAAAASAGARETPGTESASESSSESSSETSAASDGPGGHEDPPGNVENQSEAAE